MAVATVQPSHLRSLYRSFLRELPARSPSILANPSPMQRHIRADFAPRESSSSSQSSSLDIQQKKSPAQRVAEAEQHLQYLRSQREYVSLLERYNPGMNMAEEDRVRLTARRVGMDLPVELMPEGGRGGSRNGS